VELCKLTADTSFWSQYDAKYLTDDWSSHGFCCYFHEAFTIRMQQATVHLAPAGSTVFSG